MEENYCGRSCYGCELQEQLGCPGCKEGPGSDTFDYCEVAACCKIKMQDSCENCSSREVCENIKSHQSVPDYIQNELKNNINKNETLKAKLKVADKWKKLFLWSVAVIAVRCLANGVLNEVFPEIGIIGEAVCLFGMGVILLRMATAEKGYGVAGYCQLGYAASCILVLLLPDEAGLIAVLFGLIVSYIGDCKELRSHAIMLIDVDDDLADKWKKAYKWLVAACCVMLGSAVMMFVEPVTASVVNLIAEIGAFVINIIRLVYLYKSVRIFEGLAKAEAYNEHMNNELY